MVSHKLKVKLLVAYCKYVYLVCFIYTYSFLYRTVYYPKLRIVRGNSISRALDRYLTSWNSMPYKENVKLHTRGLF